MNIKMLRQQKPFKDCNSFLFTTSFMSLQPALDIIKS